MQQELMNIFCKLKKKSCYHWMSQAEVVEEALKHPNCNPRVISNSLAKLRKHNDVEFCILGSNKTQQKEVAEKEDNHIYSDHYVKLLKKLKREDILEEIKSSEEKHAASMFTRYTFFYKIK